MQVITFNGQSSAAFDLIITDYTRPLFGEVRDEYTNIEGRYGAMLKPRKMGTVDITIEFKRINRNSDDWVEQAERIAKWLYSETERPLTFDDMADGRYYVGKVSAAPEPETIRNVASFVVVFKCQPLVYGVSKTTDIGTVKNTGTFAAPYTLTGKIGAGSQSGVSVSINGTTIRYNGAVSAGDTVTIDTDQMELRVNGILQVLDVTGRFTDLKTGDNTVTASVSGTWSLRYTERFIN